MSLSEEYARQFGHRSWQQIMAALPPIAGRVVLDLGCNIGDQAAELSARGAFVIGIDSNAELLATARGRAIANARFMSGDLTQPLAVDCAVDGIWASFAAAYFPELTTVLTAWQRHLKPGGFIALTEIDDLFGHEPLEPESKALLSAYARDAEARGRYDFHMGHKLRAHLESADFEVSQAFTVADREFCGEGPVDADVLSGWASRFERMTALQRFCGAQFDDLRRDFLGALANPEHRSATTVHCCIAMRK